MRAADTVFLHGHVITVNEKDEIAEAVAVSGNQICMVGTSEEVQAAIGTETKGIDLRGRTLMPGFIDAHMHLTLLALLAGEYLDVNSDQLPTIDALKEAIAERARQVPKGTWIKCWGYEQSKLLDQRHPTAADLNEAAPDHPVQVVRCCGHMGVYNSKALALIDLEKFQPDEVMREQGRATGLLKESAHNALWSQVAFTREGLAEGLRKTSRELLSMRKDAGHDGTGQSDGRPGGEGISAAVLHVWKGGYKRLAGTHPRQRNPNGLWKPLVPNRRDEAVVGRLHQRPILRHQSALQP